MDITTVTESYLLTHIADFSDYIFDITRRVEETKLPESNITIRDIYVPSFLEAADGSLISTDMEAHLSNWAAERESYTLQHHRLDVASGGKP